VAVSEDSGNGVEEPDDTGSEFVDGAGGGSASTEPSQVPEEVGNAVALVAVGGPVANVPGASMQRIHDFKVNAAGQFVYTGSYKSGDNFFEGIWVGSNNAQQLLLSTGSLIDEIESNEKYARTERFSLASDGSVAHVIRMDGPTERENDALVISTSESQKKILEAGDKLQGLIAEETVEGIESISHSPMATAIVVKDSRSRMLWVYTNDGFTEVAKNDSLGGQGPIISNTCHVYLSRYYLRPFRMLDNGSLIFEGYVDDVSGECTQGSAIVKYTGGNYQLLVTEGQRVYGTQKSTFNDVKLLGVTDNGVSLVHAILETPTGDKYYPDKKWSYWAFPEAGEPRLIALEGEEVQVGNQTKYFSERPTHLDYDDVGNVAFMVDFGDPKTSSFFGGSAHLVQPYATIPAPGASSLRYVIDRTALLTAPFKDSEYFSTLGKPAVDSAGRLIFYGEITDAALKKITARSIWQADFEHNIIERVKEGDKVSVGGVLSSIKRLVQDSKGASGNTGVPQVTGDGAIVFRADLETGGDVIVYLEPPPR
jgi:hypothetical protein